MPDKQFSVDELNQHLNSLLVLDANTVMLTIYNTLVSWVHGTYKDTNEYQTAYDKFVSDTRKVIHREPFSHSRDKVQSLSHGAAKHPEETASELASHLDQLPPENAIEFLSELTGAWCLSCPKEKVRQYYKDENISHIELAETLFSSLLRPFEFFW
jgi:hypothetical protein